MTRPVLTASRPSQTMAQMGPEAMSGGLLAWRCFVLRVAPWGLGGAGKGCSYQGVEYVQAIRPGKKGLPARSA